MRAQGRLQSLQVGRGALHSELVPTFIAHHPVFFVAVMLAGWLLTVVLPILLKVRIGQKD